jgi:hypothetical protein
MTKLHARTYNVSEEDAEIDREVAVRLAALQFIRPEHLDIPTRYHNEHSWMVREIIMIMMACELWPMACELWFMAGELRCVACEL